MKHALDIRKFANVVIMLGLALLSAESASAAAVPAEWQKVRTLTGLYGEGCGGRSFSDAEGTVQLKCGKANKKGIAKVSLTITPFSGKKRTYKAVSVNVSQGGVVNVRWSRQKYAVSIDGNEFFGEPIYAGARPACSPNAVWSAKVGGAVTKSAMFDFGAVPALPASADDMLMERLYVYNEQSGDELTYEVFAPVAVKMNGKKWTVQKAANVKWKKCPRNASCIGDWVVNQKGNVSNIPGLKLSYNAKTGVFKGSFFVYSLFRGKKYKANVNGVLVNGVGIGQASCSKLSATPWAVTVE